MRLEAESAASPSQTAAQVTTTTSDSQGTNLNNDSSYKTVNSNDQRH
jgi:hypothetical protein